MSILEMRSYLEELYVFYKAQEDRHEEAEVYDLADSDKRLALFCKHLIGEIDE